MQLIKLESIEADELRVYSALTERELRGAGEEGLFIAESPKVILSALECGYQPVSLLCEEKHIYGDAAPIIAMHPEMTVYTGSRTLLESLTGYRLTRSAMCHEAKET